MNMQVLLEKVFHLHRSDEGPNGPHARETRRSRRRDAEPPNENESRGSARGGRRASGRGKRTRVESDDERDSEDDGEEPLKRVKVLAKGTKPAFLQPALVTGVTLKDYQLEGVAWMASLWENCISGILGESLRLLFIVRHFIESGL